MATLKVRNFSCIDEADLELGRLTILIGPQASGKSIITKLANFCYNIGWSFLNGSRIFTSQAVAAKYVTTEFSKRFPSDAWGRGRFEIDFEFAGYALSITRTGTKTRPGKGIRSAFSDNFVRDASSVSEAVLNAVRKSSETVPAIDDDPVQSVRTAARDRYRSQLGTDYNDFQVFIPAGRSFFTGMDKAFQAFDQGSLDTLTASFGRMFLTIKEQMAGNPSIMSVGNDPKARLRAEITRELFDGDLTLGKSSSFITCKDGRILPFAILSSGQQELLPLWLVLLYYERILAWKKMIYIEEPEAHLFPRAQDLIAIYLATRVSGADDTTSLFITTHSPYILAKFNNLLKAGSIVQRYPKARDQVEKVVSRQAWLSPGFTRAYAIVDRKVISILEDDLIDAAYLDQISSHIGLEFDTLLDIESEADSR